MPSFLDRLERLYRRFTHDTARTNSTFPIPTGALATGRFEPQPSVRAPEPLSLEKLQDELARHMNEPVRNAAGQIIAPRLAPDGGGYIQVREIYEFYMKEIQQLLNLLRQGNVPEALQMMEKDPKLRAYLQPFYAQAAHELAASLPPGAQINPVHALYEAARQLDLQVQTDYHRVLANAGKAPAAPPAWAPPLAALASLRPTAPTPPREPQIPEHYARWYRAAGGGWTTDTSLREPHFLGSFQTLSVGCTPRGLASASGLAEDTPLSFKRTRRGGWVAKFVPYEPFTDYRLASQPTSYFTGGAAQQATSARLSSRYGASPYATQAAAPGSSASMQLDSALVIRTPRPGEFFGPPTTPHSRVMGPPASDVTQIASFGKPMHITSPATPQPQTSTGRNPYV